MRKKGQHLAAIFLLLLATLFLYREVLPDLGKRLPLPERHTTPQQSLVYQSDQVAVAGMIGLKASRMLADPLNFAEKSSCYPLTNPYTLGEHMFGETALGLLPYTITRNPIKTFNLTIILHLWIAGISMYVLAFYWTRSFTGALFAAIAFSLHPLRATNPAHLFSTGNIWVPMALLAAFLMMQKGSWRATAALIVLLALQILESFYQVFGLFLLGGTYGAALLWQNRKHLRARLPQIVVTATIVGLFAWNFFSPYLTTRTTWGILQGRETTTLLQATDFLPGGDSALGWTVLLFAIIGLVDRLRYPRLDQGRDPRLPLLAGGLAVFLCCIPTIPGLGITGPIFVLREIIPGLDGMRVLRSIAVGVFLVADLFAAYGIMVVVRYLPPAAQLVSSIAIVALALVETIHPALSQASYGRTSGLGYTPAGLSDEAIELYRSIPDGAVLNYPAYFGPWRKVTDGPLYLASAGFHGNPTAACYNSFSTYVQDGIGELAQQLPARHASDALYALGFRTIALHKGPARIRDARRLRSLIADPTRLEAIGARPDLELYRLKANIEITEDLEQLQALPPTTYVHPILKKRQWIPMYMINNSDKMFRHPEPIQPRPATVTWKNQQGTVVGTGSAMAFLPLALSPGKSIGRGIEIDIPPLPANTYLVSISLERHPSVTLGITQIDLQPGAGHDAPER